MSSSDVDARVLDASMDAVVVTDGAGTIVRWNAAAEAIFGWTAEQVVGRDLGSTIVPVHLRAAHRRGLAALAAGGTPRIPGGRTETVGVRADGTTFPVELTISRVEDAGRPGEVAFFGFLRDITERHRLLADLTESRAQLIKVSDETRRRVERDLHDGAQQQLVAVAIALAAARDRIDADPVAGRALVERSSALLDDAIEELRDLARGVHSAILGERGLPAAITHLAGRSPIDVHTDLEAVERLPGVVETSVYYLVSEALTNAAKYGASRIDITLGTVGTATGRDLTCVLRDDGPGGADPRRGTGLAGMTERVRALDGEVALVSPVGEGTTLSVRVPIPVAIGVAS